MPIRLILADDHPLILKGLENLFHLEKDFQVLASCTDGIETMKALKQYRPDILVLDIRMPGKDGLEILRQMQKEDLSIRVVILTAVLEEKQLIEAVHLGAQGIILKEMAPQLLIQCIRKVHAGGQWIERRSTMLALEKMMQREAAARDITPLLSKREIDIVRMVAEGLRNKQIADKLFISEGTVKVHLHNIYEKLNVDSRLGLLRYARERGLS